MTPREQILQQALSLPAADRAFVAAALAESLATTEVLPTAPPSRPPEDDTSTAVLLSELDRRSQSYRTGESASKSATDVLEEQQRRQGSENPA